jgi:hypothetical protein
MVAWRILFVGIVSGLIQGLFESGALWLDRDTVGSSDTYILGTSEWQKTCFRRYSPVGRGLHGPVD